MDGNNDYNIYDLRLNLKPYQTTNKLLRKIIDAYDDKMFNLQTIFNDIKYWFLYRFHKKYISLWLIKPKTLKIGYNDPCELLLHASMQIAVEFYDLQITGGHVDWTCDESHVRALSTLKEIRDWWVVGRDEMYKKIDELLSVTDYNTIHKYEEQIDEIDQEMMHKLVDIRLFLWD